MCKYCDFRVDVVTKCGIFKDPLTDEWYLSIRTDEYDELDESWIYQRLYGIKYCPYCGRKL